MCELKPKDHKRSKFLRSVQAADLVTLLDKYLKLMFNSRIINNGLLDECEGREVNSPHKTKDNYVILSGVID